MNSVHIHLKIKNVKSDISNFNVYYTDIISLV